MQIANCVSTDSVEHDVKTPVSNLQGTFDVPESRVVLVTDGGALVGVVSQA